jgi:nucleoside 2-deoxyribosyltransferase
MKEYLIYLAGPITGMSYEGTTDWRQLVRRKLPPHFHTLSPMRGKGYLAGEKVIVKKDYGNVLSTPLGIVNRDRNDVSRCDLVFINYLGSEKVSIGTAIEIGWANAWNKPIVIVMEKDNINDHKMIQGITNYIFTDLGEAVMFARTFLSAD